MMNIEKFNSKWTPEPFSGCWLWLSGITNRGYGATYPKGKLTLAHRSSWEIYKGEIPQGLLVCHTCDTPLCVNPAHLYLGTQTDNMRDRKARGRWSGNIKLSTADIKAIRLSSDSPAELARRFGVKPRAIMRTQNLETWKNV